MNTKRLLAMTATAAIASIIPMAPTVASAAPAETFHGTFTSVTYTPYVGEPTTVPASGTWNVSVRGSSMATATFNMFVNGVHHLAYGVPGLAVDVTGGGWTFGFDTLAGPLVITLNGTTFTYDIANYNYGGRTFADVTYTGQLN